MHINEKYSYELHCCSPNGVGIRTTLQYNETSDHMCVGSRFKRNGNGGMKMDRTCTLFLGCHVGERVLSNVFNDVEVMPHGNPGYDFVCNRGKKIDVKSSCLRGDGDWMFNIKRNTTADYFLCLAFDNRRNLEPQYIWLIPAHVLNEKMAFRVNKITMCKWDEYQLDKVEDISECCNKLRGGL